MRQIADATVEGSLSEFGEPALPDSASFRCSRLTEQFGLIAGLFMLRRHNWARWLALAWMAFHVALSAFPPFHGLVFHVLILGGIAYLLFRLFRSDATEYFRGEAG